uniref:DNA polymerase epsilon subunit n=1 Tax=Odontella aurita TaxID=265563 RepID=A0A7S4I565_9STRA|mmetsp:Transcript_20047/g.58013  ORF Transcript_20047/g.58013 Transcript_20047/m.58013 type:complete len:553 (+) Transcript_20047:315-1973(+)
MNSQYQNRRRVARAFKMRGLAVQASALDAMLNVLKRESPHTAQETLHMILDEIKERMMSSSNTSQLSQLVVTKRLLSDVVADMSRDGGDFTDEAVQLLDAFQMPRLAYDSMRKQFTLMTDSSEERSLFAEAPHKADMYAQRYGLIQQRILRQDLFRPRLVTADGRRSDESNATHVLTPVESLLGQSGLKFLLGMIVQVEEGRYYLEDTTAQVPMDLTGAEILTDGFITENCIVLVEGEMVDGIFQVVRMGHPIIETRQDALDAIGLQNTDIFNSMSSLAEQEKMREQEIRHGQDGEFVILSDLHLDNPVVFEKLEKMFDAYQDLTPLPIFVFMGNFSSKPLTSAREGPKMMVSYFEELANLIGQYPKLAKEGRFIFVPGPNDPGMGSVLPRPPIPAFFTGAIRSKVPHANFVSNPCRMRYFSQEIVFCRQDIVNKLRRNALISPSNGDIDKEDEQRPVQHALKSMLDQGHLSPLPQSFSPICWQYDHALRLYPLPNALIVGDRVKQCYESYAECDAVNPGSFPSDFSFVVYRPVGECNGDEIKSDVEFSQIG